MKRETTKILAFSIFALFLIAFFGGIVGAQAETPTAEIDIAKIASFLVGEIKGEMTSEILLVKFLVGFLFVLIFYAVLTSINVFKKSKWIAFIIAFVPVFIGMRFIEGKDLMSLFLPTSAYILAGTLFIQIALIIYINVSIFKGTGIFRQMIWYLWAIALAYLLLKYGVWVFISNNSLPLLGNQPDFILSKLSVILYIAAIIIAIAGSKIDVYFAKWFKEEEFKTAVTTLEENLKKQQKKRQLEAESLSTEIERYPID